ncbi:MAG TPA: hypothetical protein VJJ26_03265, partial [Candidatus Babeliales bacterium]|nr:hypothetical protein [Candidatus Babeliales bacterium]
VNPNQSVLGELTPLIYSVILRNLPGVKILLEAGADPELAGSSGMTPLGAANIFGEEQIHAFIMSIIQINKKHLKK